MTSGDNTSSTVTLEATTLLAHIGQVVHWLPKREAPRTDLHREVATMEQHLATETLSRAASPQPPGTRVAASGEPPQKPAESTGHRASRNSTSREVTDGERHLGWRKQSEFGARLPRATSGRRAWRKSTADLRRWIGTSSVKSPGKAAKQRMLRARLMSGVANKPVTPVVRAAAQATGTGSQQRPSVRRRQHQLDSRRLRTSETVRHRVDFLPATPTAGTER